MRTKRKTGGRKRRREARQPSTREVPLLPVGEVLHEVEILRHVEAILEHLGNELWTAFHDELGPCRLRISIDGGEPVPASMKALAQVDALLQLEARSARRRIDLHLRHKVNGKLVEQPPRDATSKVVVAAETGP